MDIVASCKQFSYFVSNMTCHEVVLKLAASPEKYVFNRSTFYKSNQRFIITHVG